MRWVSLESFPEDMKELVKELYETQRRRVPAAFSVEVRAISRFPRFVYDRSCLPEQEDAYIEELVKLRANLFPVLLVEQGFIDGAHRIEALRRTAASVVDVIVLPYLAVPSIPLHGYLTRSERAVG